MEEVEFCDPFDRKKYDYWMKLEHAGRYVFAKDFINNNFVDAVVADISCATGYGTAFLADCCKMIDGYDFNEEYLRLAERRKIQNAKFFQVDFNNEILDNKCYDVVASFETIEHIDSTENFLKSLSNIVKNGGVLLLSVPNSKFEELDENGNIKYKFHKHVFKEEEMKTLLEKHNFEIVKVLGQSLCNRIVAKEEALKECHPNIYSKNLLNRYNYSPKSIIMNSYIYAFPDEVLLDESYSHIYICRRK